MRGRAPGEREKFALIRRAIGLFLVRRRSPSSSPFKAESAPRLPDPFPGGDPLIFNFLPAGWRGPVALESDTAAAQTKALALPAAAAAVVVALQYE